MNRIVPRHEAPRHLQNDYIQIFKGGGCFSAVGRQRGPQKLSLGNYCATDVGTPIHELMHAIGKYEKSLICSNEDLVFNNNVTI